jgi:hypothetical protein
MDAGQKRYLEERYSAKKWHGRSQYAKRTIKNFTFAGSELRGWKIQRMERDENVKPPVLHSIWFRSEAAAEILSIDLWECPSIKTAHDQLLEVLANMQSGDIEGPTSTKAPGDVAFGLADTMILFARGNLVVLIRNAGRQVVVVRAIATGIDALLVKRLKSDSRKGQQAV